MQWKTVISHIKSVHELTQPQIAKKVGCAQATISDLETGKTSEPRHSLGQALLAMSKAKPRKAKSAA